MSFDLEAAPEENEANMTEMLALVKTGQVTYAVRDTVINDIEVQKGNYIGIANGALSIANSDIVEATVKTVETLVDDETAIITLYYGEDTPVDEAEKMQEMLAEKYSDIDVEIYEGNQPLYYYLIAVE